VGFFLGVDIALPLPSERVSTISRAVQEEARAFLKHPVLGPRLIECTGIVAELHGRSAEQIFGSIDARKLRSSMTLFMRATPDEPLFKQVLDRYFDGLPDAATDSRLLA
jgi:uncharacterized protein (DUF1810 family)